MVTKKEWQERTSQGLCGVCGKEKSLESKKECKTCNEKRRKAQRERYALKKKDISNRRKQYKSKGLCSRCGKKRPEDENLTCDTCLKRQRELEQESKDRVFKAYGGYVCSCCGEDTKEFLMLDHIHNDGADHRREVFGGRKQGSGRTLYGWIERNEFPPIFQVLCANCNWGKRINGVCPHKWKS